MDAHSSQSFTSNFAGTQTKPHVYNSAHYAYLSNQIKRLIDGEELSYDSLQLMLDTVEQLDKDAAPIYPEPEGDPSY